MDKHHEALVEFSFVSLRSPRLRQLFSPREAGLGFFEGHDDFLGWTPD